MGIAGVARLELAGALAAALIAAACAFDPPPQTTPPWNIGDTKDITGPADDLPAKLLADIFVDGTESMAGFAAVPLGQYARLLDDVEASIINSGRDYEIRYFKFGTHVRSIERPEFRTANRAAFYRERGLSETTAIDAVLSEAQAARLTIVVTDLFQNDGDVNAILDAARTFLGRQSAVGILAVPSAFDGIVYDARVPPYKYTSGDEAATRRPFYALLFGRDAEILRLVNAMPRGNLDRSLFTLVTRFPVSGYSATIGRKANLNALEGDKPNAPLYRFAMQDRDKTSHATATIALTRRLGVPPIDPKGVSLSVQRLAPGAAATDDAGLRLVEREGAGDAMTLGLVLEPGSAVGVHQYRVDVRLPDVDAYTLPPWVNAWSSDNPSPGHEPNRTLNLASFVRSLLQTSSSIKPSLIVGRFHINLQQK